MTPEDFISILENGDFFDVEAYQKLLEQYPYAQGLRLAYLQQLKKYNPNAYKVELSRMAVYAPSRTALYYSLKRKEGIPEEILPLPVIKQELESQTTEIVEEPELEKIEVPVEEIKPIEPVVEKEEENEYIKAIQESTGLTEDDESSHLELEETLEELPPVLEFVEEEEVEDHSNLLLQQIIISTQKVKEHEHHQKEALPENGFVSDEELEMIDDEVEWGILGNLNVDTELYSDTKEEISKEMFKKKKKGKSHKKHKSKSPGALLFAFVEDNHVSSKEEDKTFGAVDEIVSADNLLIFNDEGTVETTKSVKINKNTPSVKKKKKQRIKKILHRISTQNLEEDEAIISETLASLLAEQGKKSLALKMYQQLILKNPQRSAFFADKIKELTA